MARSIACIFDPDRGYEPRTLDQSCPKCGRNYGFPLDHPPQTIGDYTVTDAISRGFYGVVYRARLRTSTRPRVIKIVPTAAYELPPTKSWLDECILHEKVASGSQHFAGILTWDDAIVSFDGTPLACHWAELEHVDGVTLRTFLNGENVTAFAVAQIAMDMLEMLRVLQQHGVHHNDLHEENVMVELLSPEKYRVGQVAQNIRAVLIDFGSLTEGEPKHGRLTDRENLGEMLVRFSERLLGRPDHVTDRDYRLAATLSTLRDVFVAHDPSGREPTLEDCTKAIRRAVSAVDEPDWVGAEDLASISEGYNAQTLRPGLVARLMLDPGEEWHSNVCTRGPQVITGMRGCGKTMLLKSLDFHTRVALAQVKAAPPLELAEKDKFIGLYVSSQRLLDARRNKVDPRPLLFAAYAREAARALRHLRKIDSSLPDPQAVSYLGEVVRDFLIGSDLDLASLSTELDLELWLLSALNAMASGSDRFKVEASASSAFEALANAMRRTATFWSTFPVFFLLDDVSTRHLNMEAVVDLLAELMFQKESCAFKITTESMTYEDVLQSPGKVERLRQQRDYSQYDLGRDVSKRLNRDDGWTFLDDLLYRRSQLVRDRVPERPQYVLGRATLESIAERIVASTSTSNERKRIYHGIDALANVCVGDIGDTINVYEKIIAGHHASRGDAFPVDPRVQHDALREYGENRLLELNNRKPELKDFAIGFASASYKLMLRSARRVVTVGRRPRLRQYYSVLIRLGDDDARENYKRIRELIDAGVFVFAGGVQRSKTRDFDPLQSFTLAFRKLFGITSYIGLANRDRFELSGDTLRQWLDDPSKCEEILFNNQVESVDRASDFEADERPAAEGPRPIGTPLGLGLKDLQGVAHHAIPRPSPKLRSIVVEPVSLRALSTITDGELIAGLGFEKRASESTRRLLDHLKPASLSYVRYPLAAYDEKNLLQETRRIVAFRVTERATPVMPRLRQIIDVTGLSKPFIFNFIRAALKSHDEVLVVHTEALSYAPTEADVANVLDRFSEDDPRGRLEAVSSLLTGESSQYRLIPLLPEREDVTRARTLIANSSAKPARLMALFAEQMFERCEIVYSLGETARARLSRVGAEVATVMQGAARNHAIDPHDAGAMLRLLHGLYLDAYHANGTDVAFGLTGSKAHAVAMAAFSTVAKVAEAWYASPTEWDPATFTTGVGETRVYRLRILGT